MNMKLVIAVAGIWVALYTAGRWLGKRYSYAWENNDTVKAWVAPRLVYHPDSSDGKPSGTFSFQCPPDSYQYRLNAEGPQVGVVTGFWQQKGLERNPVTVEDLPLLANVLNIPLLKNPPELVEAFTQLESRNYMVAAIVGGFFGFGLGFKQSYKPAPSCHEVHEALQDPRFWRSLDASKARTLYSLQGIAVLGKAIPAPSH